VTHIPALLTAADKEMSEPTARSLLPAVVVGGDEDTRLLLRGLLRLNRHRVLLESPKAEGLSALPASNETKVLVVDAGSDPSHPWDTDLATVLRARSDLRALVIVSSSDPSLESRARAAGARRVLVRPFAIREFLDAVDWVGHLPNSG